MNFDQWYEGRQDKMLLDKVSARIAFEWAWSTAKEDDARLAAMSHELLEALKYTRRFLKKQDHDTDYVDEVISSATGKI